MVLHSLFLGEYTFFQLTFQPLVCTSRSGRISVYSYQLHCHLPGLFVHNAVFPKVIQSGGKGCSLSRISRIWFSCTAICGFNDVRFFNQYPCTSSFPGSFQLGIFLHCIFTISWLILTFSILFTVSNCFVRPIHHSACWPYSFLILQISFQNLIISSGFRIILWPCFSLLSSLYTYFWLTWNSWFCLDYEILC